MEPLQLRSGVEDYFRGEFSYFPHFFLGPCDAVRVCFLALAGQAKLLMPEPGLVKRARRCPIHVLAHERKNRPCRKAFESQNRLRARFLSHVRDFLHVLLESHFVDKIVRRFQLRVFSDKIPNIFFCCHRANTTRFCRKLKGFFVF